MVEDGDIQAGGAATLIDEALRKAAVAWITVPGRQPVALWCLPQEDASRPAPHGRLYLVSGPGEQAAPGLLHATSATVTLRGDHGGRIVTWPAEVRRVAPDTEEWNAVAPLLAGKRLNAPVPADALVARWAAECAVHCLTPTGAPAEAGATLPDSSQAEPPRESTVVRPTRRPFRLHRVRRRD
jgi:hypothetical protein